MNNQSLGKYGEALAAEYLTKKGFGIIQMNFKNKIGEIDIIAKDGKEIVFVEVKSRQSLSCGMPYESVHYHKQRKMAQLAQSYLKYKYNTVEIFARFDVVSIYKDESGKDKLEHIPNAFSL